MKAVIGMPWWVALVYYPVMAGIWALIWFSIAVVWLVYMIIQAITPLHSKPQARHRR